jgi:hypothetical protein
MAFQFLMILMVSFSGMAENTDLLRMEHDLFRRLGAQLYL